MRIQFLISGMLLLLSFGVYGQDTTYYDVDKNKVKSVLSARYYTVTEFNLPDSSRKVIREYDMYGIIKSEIHYARVITEQGNRTYVYDGKYKEWYSTGLLCRDIDYATGKINGELQVYWSGGNLRRKEQYRDDKLINSICYAGNGKETNYVPYVVLPVFEGGESALMQYLATNLRYPVELEKKGIQGKVIVGFLVSTTGVVNRVEIVQKDNELFNKEAVRVVSKMPRWKPGRVEGELASVHYTLPITFRLE